VEKRVKSLGFTEGSEGVREIFHNFLTEQPLAEHPTDSSLNIVDPSHSEIAGGLQTATYDVFGGPDIPATADTRPFVIEDDLYPGETALSSIDAIIVSGSGESVRYLRDPSEKDKWEGKIRRLQKYLRYVIDNHRRIKLIGICFGHQIISFASGKAVDRNPKGWEVGPTDISLTNIGKDVFKKGYVTLQQIHQDHVLLNYQPGGLGDSGQGGYGGAPPKNDRPTSEVVIDTEIKPIEDLKRWGESDLTTNQGVIRIPVDAEHALKNKATWFAALEKIQIFTSQGHPEMTRDIMNALLLDYQEPDGPIPADRAGSALARNKDTSIELDSKLVAVVCWQMLKGAHRERMADMKK
jgi:GMP synthase-like glutamine amidotransferase